MKRPWGASSQHVGQGRLSVSLFSARGAEATQESLGHKDSSVWGQVGLFRSGELSDAKSVAPGCGAYDSVLWPFWNREGGGVCQSPWTRTVSRTSATGTVTGFPFPSGPSSLMPASSSSSVLSPLSSLFLLRPLFCLFSSLLLSLLFSFLPRGPQPSTRKQISSDHLVSQSASPDQPCPSITTCCDGGNVLDLHCPYTVAPATRGS